MRIVSIFDGKLYAFRYKGRTGHELRRVLTQWKDIKYVEEFLASNISDLPANRNVEQIAESIIESAYDIEGIIAELAKDDTRRLEEFFKPLYNLETGEKILSLQKGREQYLRLYALKIDNNCFVITGGAIKFTRFMDERDHTESELKQLHQCRDFLRSKDVFDLGSFYELINE